jgi:fatty acid desaturase
MSKGGWYRRLEPLLDIPLFPISLLHELTHYAVYRAAGVPAEMHLFDGDRKAHVTIEPSHAAIPDRVNKAVTFAPLSLLLLSVPAVVLAVQWLARSDNPFALVGVVFALLLLVQSFPSSSDIHTLVAAGWSDRRIQRTSLFVSAFVWVLALLVSGVAGFVSG